jgi:acyl-CoA synthetase (NDP forming)
MKTEVASLRHVLRPTSVAVVGASRRTGTVGRAILHNIVTGGYQGKVYAINPHGLRMEGIRCLPSVDALPEPVDLAVVAVPPAAVPVVADGCGRCGVGAVMVITAGLDVLQEADLLAVCRRYGMRLVGPGSAGIAVPGSGLNATLAARHLEPGMIGLVMQSSGLGLALANRLSRLGLGISSFASVGDRCDVCSNDMLRWWERDETTRLAVLQVESVGNPRAFVRTARRIGAVMPVVALRPGSRAGSNPTAGAPSSAAPVSLEDLFQQAGVIAAESADDVLATAALLASQPTPAGPHVAVISNVGAAADLAAEACSGRGVTVPTMSAATRRRLRALLPPGGVVTGPVDTTVAVSAGSFRRCLELVAGDQDVDAILALVLPTATTGDLTAAVRAADVAVPLAAVVLDQEEAVRMLPRTADPEPGREQGAPGSVPAYSDPQTAAGALARAAAYGAWRARASRPVLGLGSVRQEDARGLARAFLARAPRGGWLAPGQATALLGCYGIELCHRAARGGGGAGFVVGAAQTPGYGPLVTFGRAGTGPDEPADRSARLAPLTDTDADELIAGIRPALVPPGRLDVPDGDRLGLREILLLVSRLADDLPEVAELSISATITRGGAVSVAGSQMRLAPVHFRGLPRRRVSPGETLPEGSRR